MQVIRGLTVFTFFVFKCEGKTFRKGSFYVECSVHIALNGVENFLFFANLNSKLAPSWSNKSDHFISMTIFRQKMYCSI